MLQKNQRPISLMNIHAKTLNNILGKWNQQYIERTIHHDEVGFIPGTQGQFRICKSISVICHINKWKDKKSFLCRDTESVFGRIQYPFMIKKLLSKLGLEGIYLSIMQNIFINPYLISCSMVRS